jgi:hypothetical protein
LVAQALFDEFPALFLELGFNGALCICIHRAYLQNAEEIIDIPAFRPNGGIFLNIT